MSHHLVTRLYHETVTNRLLISVWRQLWEWTNYIDPSWINVGHWKIFVWCLGYLRYLLSQSNAVCKDARYLEEVSLQVVWLEICEEISGRNRHMKIFHNDTNVIWNCTMCENYFEEKNTLNENYNPHQNLAHALLKIFHCICCFVCFYSSNEGWLKFRISIRVW